MIKKQLDSLQRSFALKICKGHRTVSLTSALLLSGLLPLDLRIGEAAQIYTAKKGFSDDNIPPGREVEEKVSYLDTPHPSRHVSITYESLDNMDPETTSSLDINGPQIYTDGSKIEGKVGAALTWWEQGGESRFSTFRLEPHCTVFQSEMYALYRATKMVRGRKEERVGIFSDSKSSLDMLTCPVDTHPLAVKIKECVRDIREQGRSVNFFWLRAHVGTLGNERADELAKKAALTKKTAADYDKVPISFVKKQIRQKTLTEWQKRYSSSNTGSVTKTFFPNVIEAKKILRGVPQTPVHTQIFTGHGGFAEYLHRFKIKENNGCVCDPEIAEDIWHILLECPRFGLSRLNLEAEIDRTLDKSTISEVLAIPETAKPFLLYASKVVRIVSTRNK